MSDTDEKWSEDSSALYQQIARVAVPRRVEQFAALLTLLPFRKDEPFRVVELASGEGLLARAILSAFPNASLLALDYSETMRETTAARLAPFGERASVAFFDMAAPDWYPLLDGADAVVSSLCVHHLNSEEKQALFAGVARRLSERGAFLLADLVLPQRGEGRELFAATYDRVAEQQSLEQTGSLDLYRSFIETDWNYYRAPDPFDKPSPLFDQLVWLKSAGFAVADCFWMQAGHAIYGGYKSAASFDSPAGLAYDAAYEAARASLAAP